MARIAETLGLPLMPWQRQVADVGLEVDQFGRPFYREVIVTVPRQNGKTTLVLAWELDRALAWGRRQRIVYTAQTGLDARKKVLEDQVPLLESSPLKAAIAGVRRVNGSEGVNFRGGSQLDVLASSESSGHGRTVDLGVVDEAFDDVDDRREQSMLPAMATRADAQLLVWSTQGTDASVYLNRKVDDGRNAVDSGADSGIAYFEWSADEELPIDDPATWQSCMPAYGYTVGEAAVRHALLTMKEGEFRRAFLNQRTNAEERILPLEAWEAVCGATASPEGLVTFALDCNPERTWGSIAAADPEGRAELVQHERGTGWVVARACELAKKWDAPVALDPASPAGAFAAEIADEGVEVIEISGRKFAQACGWFFDAVVERGLHIRHHAALDTSAASASKRTSGDAWVWGRRNVVNDVSPLVAVTLATFAAKHERLVPVPVRVISLAALED